MLSGLIWAIRLEGRVNTLSSVSDEREKSTDERQVDLKARLVRIEDKLDQVVISSTAIATAAATAAVVATQNLRKDAGNA